MVDLESVFNTKYWLWPTDCEGLMITALLTFCDNDTIAVQTESMVDTTVTILMSQLSISYSKNLHRNSDGSRAIMIDFWNNDISPTMDTCTPTNGDIYSKVTRS